VWNNAIGEASTTKMIQAPEDNGESDDAPNRTCQKVPGHADGPHRTQKGYGFDDGAYHHSSTKIDSIAPRAIRGRGRNFIKNWGFAQLVNAGGNPDPKGALDDIVGWRRSNRMISIEYWVNKGDGSFQQPLTTFLPFECPSDDIRWADVSFNPNVTPLVQS
jgi:hypothetical protein